MEISSFRLTQDTTSGGPENSESYNVTTMDLRYEPALEGPVGSHGGTKKGEPWSVQTYSYDNWTGADTGEPSNYGFSWKGAALTYWETNAAGYAAAEKEADPYDGSDFSRKDGKSYPVDAVAAAGGAEGLDKVWEIHSALNSVAEDYNLTVDGELTSPRIRNTWTGEELARIDIAGDRAEFHVAGVDKPEVAEGAEQIKAMGARILEFATEANDRAGAEHAVLWRESYQQMAGSFKPGSDAVSIITYKPEEYEGGNGEFFTDNMTATLRKVGNGAEIVVSEAFSGYEDTTHFAWAPMAIPQFEKRWQTAVSENPEVGDVQRRDNDAHRELMEAKVFGGVENIVKALPVHQSIEQHLNSDFGIALKDGIREVTLLAHGGTDELGTLSFTDKEVSWKPGKDGDVLLGSFTNKPVTVSLDDKQGIEDMGRRLLFVGESAKDHVDGLSYALADFSLAEKKALELKRGIKADGTPLRASATDRQIGFELTTDKLKELADQLAPAAKKGFVTIEDTRTRASVAYWNSRTHEEIAGMTVDPEKPMHKAKRLISNVLGAGR